MKFLILSDLHIEHASFSPPADLQFDAVILAGDIHSPGRRAVHWARSESVFGTEKPIILVPGNHEFYRACMSTELRLMCEAAEGTNVHVAHRQEIILDDPAGGQVRVLGCTLWTDFLLPIAVDERHVEHVELALATANRKMNDFQLIDVEFRPRKPEGAPDFKTERRRLTAEDTVAMHWVDRSWLLRKLLEPFDGATVVVTHHAPSADSLNEKYTGHHLTPAFASDLPDAAFLRPHGEVLWVHGHTHTSADYSRKTTRIVSNPRGYPRKSASFENGEFDPGLIIEVDAARQTLPKPAFTEADVGDRTSNDRV